MRFRGTIHNARLCMFDGRDSWIAAVEDERGHFSCRPENVHEASSIEEARAWLRGRLIALGEVTPIIDVQA